MSDFIFNPYGSKVVFQSQIVNDGDFHILYRVLWFVEMSSYWFAFQSFVCYVCSVIVHSLMEALSCLSDILHATLCTLYQVYHVACQKNLIRRGYPKENILRDIRKATEVSREKSLSPSARHSTNNSRIPLVVT